jgi:hypothetical protein
LATPKPLITLEILSARPRSLAWFAAFRGVKHNREEEIALGTLEIAFAAVAACLALFTAQFGPDALGAQLATCLDEFPSKSIFAKRRSGLGVALIVGK